MAEILLSLTIIGVVAAITLPSLTGNINERTWNTQRKALYARMSQAISLMPSLNGYGTITESESGSLTTDTAAETFVTSGLAKVLKINNICDSEHLADCGLPAKINPQNGTSAINFPKTLAQFNAGWNSMSFEGGYSFSHSNTKAAGFETTNGESIAVYYSPKCLSSMNETTEFYYYPKICANFVFDLNGSKGPNTVGKDIGFLTIFYPVDSIIVAPTPLGRMSKAGTAPETASTYCKNEGDEYRLPNMYEAAALVLNKNLVGTMEGTVATASRLDSNTYWGVGTQTAFKKYNTGSEVSFLNVYCIKRN
ncbi:MAG: type II secretion system GspH family protein [Fusobacterium sp.]|nr:type II secretion system GspH family protein [Fusobacterium sp.]